MALALVANAYYIFPTLIGNGAATGEWVNVRLWIGCYSNKSCLIQLNLETTSEIQT